MIFSEKVGKQFRPFYLSNNLRDPLVLKDDDKDEIQFNSLEIFSLFPVRLAGG